MCDTVKVESTAFAQIQQQAIPTTSKCAPRHSGFCRLHLSHQMLSDSVRTPYLQDKMSLKQCSTPYMLENITKP